MTKAPGTRPLVDGRAAFRARRWSEAARLLAEAEVLDPLDPGDYEALTTARALISHDRDAAEIFGDASRVLLERGDVRAAARAAGWAATTLRRLGEVAAGSGWQNRAQRLLDEAGIDDCVERGYLLLTQVYEAIVIAGDPATAMALIGEIGAIARRFGDDGLLNFNRHQEGRVRLLQGDVQGGLALLDEVMVTAMTTEMSPLLVGMTFCGLLQAVDDVHDLGRAREWTAAVERWCQSQPDLDIYRGECRVHRAHVLLVGGEWERASEQVGLACATFLRPPPHPAAGFALYEQGELHRLAGRYAEAEDAFSQAAALGHSAQPGLALLRLGQGRVEAAEPSIRRALAESPSPLARATLLPAQVEIALAAGDLDCARTAAAELGEIASRLHSDYLRGLALQGRGAVSLAAGEPAEALRELRRAAMAWHQLDAAYQAAQTRLLIGRACRELGDEDAARLEIEGAHRAFSQLGAGPDTRRAEALLARPGRDRPLGLTGREVQLLALLATGKTNREIAADLFISEKTVARHVSNIFDKLGVSSRAAATAYAHKHGLA